MTAAPHTETVLLIVVAFTGQLAVTAATGTGPVEISTCQPLAQFLAGTTPAAPDTDQVARYVPDGTPILRFDLSGWECAYAFGSGSASVDRPKVSTPRTGKRR